MTEEVKNIPAFPQFEMSDDGTGYCREEGMPLRDYFAGQALSNPALCTGHVGAWQLQEWFGEGATEISAAEIAARQAYACADAMLRARRDEK